MNLTVKSSDLVGRDAQITDIGSLTGAASVVFTMPIGGISGPINEGVNGAVLQLTDKQEPTAADIAAALRCDQGHAPQPAAPGGLQRLRRLADEPLREGRRHQLQQEADASCPLGN